VSKSEYKYEGREILEAMQEARNYNAFLLNLIIKYAQDTSAVMDFGAGIGDLSGTLNVPPHSVTCIEPDPDLQEMLADRGFETHSNLTGLETGRFTYIYSLNVLEHIENDKEIAGELYRVLQPGVRLFIYVPAFDILFSKLDLDVGHCRRYTIRSLTDVLESVGFAVEDKGYTDALGFLATLAWKIVYRQSRGFVNRSSVRFNDRFLFPISRVISPMLSRLFGKNVYAVVRKPFAAT